MDRVHFIYDEVMSPAATLSNDISMTQLDFMVVDQDENGIQSQQKTLYIPTTNQSSATGNSMVTRLSRRATDLHDNAVHAYDWSKLYDASRSSIAQLSALLPQDYTMYSLDDFPFEQWNAVLAENDEPRSVDSEKTLEHILIKASLPKITSDWFNDAHFARQFISSIQDKSLLMVLFEFIKMVFFNSSNVIDAPWMLVAPQDFIDTLKSLLFVSNDMLFQRYAVLSNELHLGSILANELHQVIFIYHCKINDI